MGMENRFGSRMPRTTLIEPWKSSKFGFAICIIAVLTALVTATGLLTYWFVKHESLILGRNPCLWRPDRVSNFLFRVLNSSTMQWGHAHDNGKDSVGSSSQQAKA